MIDRLMGALPSMSGGTSDLAWLLVWQSTLWLAVGLLASRVWRRRAGRAHLLLVLAMAAAVVSPVLTVVVHRMQWGFLPASPEPPMAVTAEAPVAHAIATAAESPDRAIEVGEPDEQFARERNAFPSEFAQSDFESMPKGASENREPDVVVGKSSTHDQENGAEAAATASEPPAAPTAWTARAAAVLPTMLAGVWLIASLGLLMRLVFSLLAGTRIVRAAREEANPQLIAALDEATRILGLSAKPALCTSSRVRCPMIWCWGARPVVLLPATASEAAPILWRSVFCHELAHAIRRDHWTALWAEIVVIALPWQPLAWLSRRRLSYLREQACDDWVLSTGGEATDYAESLLQLVPQRAPAHALAAVSSRESLKRRLEHVLSGVRITPKVGRHWLAAATLLALAAIAGVGFAQQGRRTAMPAPVPALAIEVAQETKSSTPSATATTSAPSSPGAQSPVPTPPTVSAGKADAPIPASPASQEFATSPKTDQAKAPSPKRKIRGRVLLPSGQPAVGASVALSKTVGSRFWSLEPHSRTAVVTLSANARGEFTVNVEDRLFKEQESRFDLWAALPNFGLAHAACASDQQEPIVLQLRPEEPIHGRFINLEGRPVRDANVEVVEYFDLPADSIDLWLASLQKDDAEFQTKHLIQTAPYAWLPASLLPKVKSNADGRVELRGIGRDQFVELRISGPRVATTFILTLTRPIAAMRKQYLEISGSKFELALSPGITVEGSITDEETGKPVPGVLLRSNHGSGTATTDVLGHYRFDGVPTAGLNCDVHAPQPYFSVVQGLRVPRATSLDPIRKDLKLIRGILTTGRAYDRATGKPVSGTIYYTPFQTSKPAHDLAAKYPTFWEALYDCGHADAEGHIRALVYPGRGIVYMRCDIDEYRFNFGIDQIKELTDRNAFLASPPYRFVSAGMYHSFREINLAPDAGEARVDLPVDPGQSIVVKFTDPSGNSLAGVDTGGLRHGDLPGLPVRDLTFVDGDRATLSATYPGETRTVWFRHRATGAAKLLQFVAKAGETERTIVLEPPAIVTGRLLSLEGKPLPEVKIQCDFGEGFDEAYPVIVSDAQGRFRRDLPAGDRIRIYVSLAKLPDLTVTAGEQIDFGDITLERTGKRPRDVKVMHRSPKRTKASTAKPAQADTKNSAQAATTPRELRGRVLLPNGQPAVGATVRVARSNFGTIASPIDKVTVLASRSTGALGDFQFTDSHLQPDEKARMEIERCVNLWATLPGYGAALHVLAPDVKTDPIVMRLGQEEPICGRLIDLEGRPIAGARVELLRYFDTQPAAIDEWIASLPEKHKPVNALADKTVGALKAESMEWAKLLPDQAILHVNSIQVVSDALFPAPTTNAEGRFELKGIGRDRLVAFRISAPRIATAFVTCVTRPIKTLPFQVQDVCGSTFERVASPSVPIEGRVLDADSGKPIPGATVDLPLLSMHRSLAQAIGVPIATQSDVQGHYRLEGADTLKRNRLSVHPPDLPYFPELNQFAPPAKTLKAVHFDVKLKHGVWIDGRAYDLASNKPVSGSVYYFPLPSNPFVGDRVITGNASLDAQGRFRVLAIPGRGGVGLSCDQGDYRFDLGKKQIKGIETMSFAEFTTNVFREVDIPPNVEQTHVDLPADAGQNLLLKFVDATGKPLSGVETYGLRFSSHATGDRGRSFIEGNSATLCAVAPGDRRTIWLRHRATGLSRLVEFEPNPGEKERTVVLEPPAILTGRFVTPDKTPLEKIGVACMFGPVYGFQILRSDAEGRIRGELPPGGPVSLFCEGFYADFGPQLTIDAGETIDLGTITVDRDPKRPHKAKVEKGPITRLKPSTPRAHTAKVSKAAADKHTNRTPPPSAPTPTRELRGRVLLPNGQPAVGATVRAMTVADWPLYWPEGEAKLLGTFSTNKDGTFEGKFNAPSMPRPASANRSVGGKHRPVVGVDINLWATLPGYGLALVPLDSVEFNAPIAIKLADEQPIRGHVLDLEGRPIRNAKVEVIHYTETTSHEVDQFIVSASATKKEYQESLLPEHRAYEVASTSIVPSVKTDSDGSFALKGFGRDRVLELRISAPKMTTSIAWVLTRPIKPIQLRFHNLVGSQFERVISPSVPVEGFVTDADTGKPIPGARILQFSVNGVSGPWSYLSTTTDSRGHYRLEGLETESSNEVSVRVSDLPYFWIHLWLRRLPAKSLEPIREDIKLRRGIWAVGRAYDRATGKPVSGRVSYFPFESNEFARKIRDDSGIREQNFYADAEGHFRTVVMPGRGVLCLQCSAGDYRFDLGRSEIKELAPKPNGGQSRMPVVPLSGRYHSLSAIDVPPNSEEVRVDLPVDPGQNVVLRFTDAAGKPLAGVETHGLRAPIGMRGMNFEQSFVEGNSAILYATYPGEARHVWLKHRASGLTKLFNFVTKAGETERTIVLDPPAFVTGRLISEVGTPLARAPIRTENRDPGWLKSFGLATGDDGRFRVELPAGGPFEVKFGAYVQLVDKLTVEPGERVDLGDISIEQNKQRPFMPKVERGPEKRTKMQPTAKTVRQSSAGRSAAATPNSNDPKPTPTTRELRGRVLLPNGQPAVGATITLIRPNWQARETEWTTVATLRTDAKGEFRGSVAVPPAKDLRGELNLWATLPGYGLAFRPFSLRAKSDAIVMNLVEDEPVRGHLIDVDGRPLRDARVEPITLRDSTPAWVDEFIASAKDKPHYMSWVYPDRAREDEGSSRDRAVLRVKASASIPSSLIPAVKTNADGRFEIKGLGRDRHVDLRISGPHVVTTVDGVVTRRIKPIAFEFREVHGSQFERVTAPSVPISGTVIDEESGKPIAGVTIRPFARAQGRTIMLVNEPTATATSDAQGHFRLEGLDTGTENQIRVDAAGLPYLDTGAVLVAASVGLKPIELEIKLHRAVWITGRAYDRATGLPVRGIVYYAPFRSNEFAKKYGAARRAPVRPYGVVKADGHFRVPAIPGRGVIFLQCNGNDYRFDLGKSEIKELADAAKRADSPTLLPIEELRYQRLREVHVAPNAQEVQVDLPVERGTNIFLKFTDAAGKPLVGVDGQGLHGARARGLSSTDTDTAPLRATSPGETRHLWLRHRTSGLTKLFDFVPKPGETERTIVLEKPAAVVGQLFSEDGTPLSRVRIECDQPFRFPSAITDREGRFRFELPGGGPFNLRASVTQLATEFVPPASLIEGLNVTAGEQIDLGRITIETPAKGQRLLKVRRSPEKRTKALAARPEVRPAEKAIGATHSMKRPATGKADGLQSLTSKDDDGPWLIRGIVLRPDGQPAAGAEVLALRKYWSSRVAWRPMATVRANAQGKFEIRVPRLGYDGLGSGLMALAARMEGFAIEWAPGSAVTGGKEPPSPIVLRLVPESLIQGRVVDLEGRPVSGVHVRVIQQNVSKKGEDLGPWLQAVQQRLARPELKLGPELPRFENASLPAIVSDRDGRFTVPGVGAERVARLEVTGETIATAQFDVATRSMKSLGPGGPSYDPTQVFGKDFTYQAAPTKPIVGTVRDGVSGRPLAGVHLELSRHKFIGTQTDAEGKFRLVGMPKETVPNKTEEIWDRNRLLVVPNLEQPYFGNDIEIPRTAGLDPVRLDIKLKRGLWITGRVTDKVTGKPVRPATIHYFPYGSNPHVNKDEWRIIVRIADAQHRVTGPDGTYRIVGLPGRAIVGVWSPGQYLKGVGASAIPGMDKNGRFPKTLGIANISEDALKEIDPPEESESFTCDFTLDPGGKMRLEFVDGAGKPVEDGFLLNLQPGVAVAWGRRKSPMEMTGLAPKESRTYQITEWQRKIAKVFTFQYDEKASNAVTVTLEPCATVRGRLLDQEGSPLKNTQVWASAKRNGKEWFSLFTFGPVTDADGRFAIENLAAGCDSYQIQALVSEEFVTVAEKVTYAPGKTIDLGEIKLRQPR